MRIGTFKEYRGYFGSIEMEADCCHGKILGIRDFVNYEADSIEQLHNEFHYAVDDYINTIKELKCYDKVKCSYADTGCGDCEYTKQSSDRFRKVSESLMRLAKTLEDAKSL